MHCVHGDTGVLVLASALPLAPQKNPGGGGGVGGGGGGGVGGGGVGEGGADIFLYVTVSASFHVQSSSFMPFSIQLMPRLLGLHPAAHCASYNLHWSIVILLEPPPIMPRSRSATVVPEVKYWHLVSRLHALAQAALSY